MIAAGRAGERGLSVLLLEKNVSLGEKLKISGGGRCNITNAEPDIHKFLSHYGDAKPFLYSAFSEFGVGDTEELGAQGTIAGGGRYDPLIERMGGKAAPACGWAMGMERVLELMKVSGSLPEAQAQCDIYVLHQGGETLTAAMIIAERLRSAGIDTILFCPPDGQSASFKSQMKKADSSGAAFAVIIGPDELANNEAQLKDLRGTGEQKSVPLDDVLGAAIDALVGASE